MPRSSQAAIDLIVDEEVSGRAAYEKRYRHPEWPGGHSGITFGIGYDIGQDKPEAAQAKLWADWKGRIPDDMIRSLEPCCGVSGEAAHALLAAVRPKVDIPFDVAMAEFSARDLPEFEGKVARSLANTDKLARDGFGALTSIAYNRGASFGLEGDRFREMRAIRDHMAAQQFDRIPAEIRSMKRLWSNGLVGRREREALLFERGLKAAAMPLGLQPGAQTLPSPPTRAGSAKIAATKTVAGTGTVAAATGTASGSALQSVVGIAIAIVIGIVVYVVAMRHRRLGKADPVPTA
jgi:hypothetical protein